MLRAEIQFATKDAALREDVSVLGRLVGELLREQGGSDLYHTVEEARTLAIRRRETGDGSDRELFELLQGLGPEEAADVVRAFSLYFRVVNLAETVHRIRRQRDYMRDSQQAQPGGIRYTLEALQRTGCTLPEIRALLEALAIQPVFTAHPTEPTRRTILEKLQRVARRLVDRLDPSMTPPEARAGMASIRAEVTSIWQTEEHPEERMAVTDELEHVTFFLTDVIYRVVPPFYEALETALEEVYAESAEVPTVLRFASWVGGDMDGNPNVTAATLQQTLDHHRNLILQRYRRELLTLAQRLSQCGTRIGIDRLIRERIDAYSELFPQAREAISPRHSDMPYRILLRLMAARLRATLTDAPGTYGQVEDFTDDLQTIAASLSANKGEHAGIFAVRRLLRRVATFGFHLATLDVRQDGLVHRAVIGAALGDPNWLDHACDTREQRLLQALEGGEPAPARIDHPMASEVLEVFAAIARSRQRHGPRSIGPYIISMAQGPDDVLAVLLLARWGGLTEADGSVPLDIAPLFETVDDLEHGPGVMQALFRLPLYREHLERRGGHQYVMVGYSDSNKDAGFASARWALQRAQVGLVAACDSAGVELTIFHGRGGTISRGGGRTHEAVLAAPRGSVKGRLRVTEQGEIINAKYGLRGIAMRTLAQALGSVMVATARPPPADPDEESWHAIMDTIAEHSRAAYRSLVYDSDGFNDYFRQATPIDVIERMRIGSRPASRRAQSGIADLRAIPWVFAWTQSRCILPGWYGFGSGLAAAFAEHGAEAVQRMARLWPFMHCLLDDAEMVLAKVELDIAERYDRLASPQPQPFFERIRTEFERTVELVLQLRGRPRLLDQDDTLRRAIRLRNPYVDPMSLLQVEVLQRWRESDRKDESLFRVLLLTVNGIAHGLQNTG